MEDKRNIRLLVEYEGTRYAGWQVQKTEATVQGELMAAVARITGEEVVLTGASRTDAGVHARGQVANFRTSSAIPSENILRGLNSLLPRDIVVRRADDVPVELDSRRDSTGKTYLYMILNRTAPSALLRRWAWHVTRPLDLYAMRRAATRLVGERDFTSFSCTDTDVNHFVREVTSVEITEGCEEGLIEVTVRGTAFLRHMVRIMAGTLVEVGLGKLAPEEVDGVIEARDRTAAPMTAPSHGLFLMKVDYR